VRGRLHILGGWITAMHLLSCFLIACLTTDSGCPQTPSAANKDNDSNQACIVSGVVIRNEDSAALNATVQLINDSDREHHICNKNGSGRAFSAQECAARPIQTEGDAERIRGSRVGAEEARRPWRDVHAQVRSTDNRPRPMTAFYAGRASSAYGIYE
jgi:hypothetical protein